MSDTYDDAPNEEDIRHDDLEFNPSLEPQKSKAWLNLLSESEDAFEDYHRHCDNIDKRFANLERLSDLYRTKQYQMFWANAEVLRPAIYAKPPVPVVVPKFLDRRPVYQAASELLERCCVVAFDLAEIDELMKLVRDDLALLDRGVAWCRYESGKDDPASPSGYAGHGERVCIDFKNRRDFLHSIARNWREVSWVAGASYLTRAEARERFKPYSGDAYQQAEYRVDKEAKAVGGADARERAKFWEIWDKGSRRVLWVAQGCEDILDEDDPHLDLRGYFPCPKPAYGTVQRGSLVPVPDVLQYKDQLDEIDLLTGRIHALSDSIQVKGFYPAGGSELSEAITHAINTNTPGELLVPISNWAAFGGSTEVVIWWPIDKIVETITQCVTLRQQIVQDIYQIMGLSDIMRGATSPEETLGAQQMKSDYGSSRIRDKQQEMVRLARDLVEIASEIITDKFAHKTIVEMSQTELPTNKIVEKQVGEIVKQMNDQQLALQKAQQLPQMQQMAQQNPQQAQQLLQQATQALQAAQAEGQKSIKKLMEQPTLDEVLKLLGDQRTRSFVLDIETDSTIMPNEQAEKQARTEFMGVLSQLLPQLAQMTMAQPKTANFCGALLKFATAPFRAGRALDGAIDEMTDMMEQMADQPKPDDPTTAQGKIAVQIEQMKLTYAKSKDDADRQLKQTEIAAKTQTQVQTAQTDAQAKAMEVQGRQAEQAAKLQQVQVEAASDAQEHQQKMASETMKAQFATQKHDQAMQANEARENARMAAEQSRLAAQQMRPPGGLV